MLVIVARHQGKVRAFEAESPALEKALRDLGPDAEVSVESLEYREGRMRRASGGRRPRPTTTIPCPYLDIVALYSECLPELKQVGSFEGVVWEKRCEQMKAMWAWVLTSHCDDDGSRRAETAEQALEWIRTYFESVKRIEWMIRPSGVGKYGKWRADFDYLITGRAVVKVLEECRDMDRR